MDALRNLDLKKASIFVAFAMSTYHVTVGYLGEPVAEIHRPIHLLFALLVLFWSRDRSGLGHPMAALLYDLVLSGLLIASCGYLFVNAEEISQRMIYVTPLSPTEIFLGSALILVILEAARRSVGLVLVIVGAFFLAYTQFGPYMPEPFWHDGYSISQTIEHMYLTPSGIWTTPIAVTASFVFLFVLFGSLLLSSGAGDFFTDLAKALTGRQVGGPAKTAVVSSAFMGMLSGSSAANVVTTGSFTIPAMVKAGYRPHFAAGVEACASCGGQLTPPIMGSAAFIMMEFIGISYLDVMGISIIPALLYFIACFGMVDLEARRAGLKPMLQADLPRLWDVLKKRGYLLLAIIALLYYLFEGYTPSTAAFWSIVYLACLVVIFDEETRRPWIFAMLPVAWVCWFFVPGFGVIPALSGALITGAAIILAIDVSVRMRFLRIVWNAATEAPRLIAPVTVACAVGGMIIGVIPALSGALITGAVIILAIDGDVRTRFLRIVWNAATEAPRLIAPVTVACAVGGMIIGVISLTGLGERMSAIVLELGGGHLFLTLLLTMVMAVFLGMGMPTSGAYVVLATLLVPALEGMLVPHYQEAFGLTVEAAGPIAVVASHMFIIFCASKSSLTPPVAIASYAAAAVANTDPWKTSITAFRIGLPIFIIPYMFIFGPQLLGYLDPVQIALSFLTATTGVLVLSVTCIGWFLLPLTLPERLLSGVSALFLMFSGWRTDLIGLALLAILFASAYWRFTRLRNRTGTSAFAPGAPASEDEPAVGLTAARPHD